MQLDRYTNIILSDGTNTYSVENGDIAVASGTLALNEVICDGELAFGSLCSNKFECELYFPDTSTSWEELTTQSSDNIDTQDSDNLLVRTNVNPDLEGMSITVEIQSNDGEDTTSIFVGTIESSTTDNYNYHRKIVAYDRSYYIKNTDVATIYNNYFDQVNGDPTLSGLRTYLCTQMNITCATRSSALPNDSLIITKGAYSSMTFETLIGAICELQCCFPNFNRSGQLEFITLGTASKTVSNYETGESSFEDYVTNTITGIRVFSTSDSLVQQYPTNNIGTNPMSISGNFLLLDLTAENINTACYNMYIAINQISYKPCEIKMIVSDLGIATETLHQNLLIGDYITSDKGNHYIFEQDLSGQLFVDQTLICTGEESFSNDVSSKNDVIATNQKFSTLEQTVDSISTSVGDAEGRLTTLEQTSASLDLQVTTIEDVLEGATDDAGNVVAKAVTTTEGFTFDADGLTITQSGSDVSTNIDEDGMTIMKGSTVLLTAKSEQDGNASGVETYRLKANGYLSIGDYSRLMDYTDDEDNHRTGCFWIEEN